MSNTLSIDLLAPHYEVIADYPFNDRFKVGDVLQFFMAKDGNKKEHYYHHDNTHQNFSDLWFDMYPHLFRKLSWWEKREPSEMPEYLKTDETWEGEPSTMKVKSYYGEDREYVEFENPEIDSVTQWCTEWFLPATEQEYTEYLKSKP